MESPCALPSKAGGEGAGWRFIAYTTLAPYPMDLHCLSDDAFIFIFKWTLTGCGSDHNLFGLTIPWPKIVP